jgi:hypothetical protein
MPLEKSLDNEINDLTRLPENNILSGNCSVSSHKPDETNLYHKTKSGLIKVFGRPVLIGANAYLSIIFFQFQLFMLKKFNIY